MAVYVIAEDNLDTVREATDPCTAASRSNLVETVIKKPSLSQLRDMVSQDNDIWYCQDEGLAILIKMDLADELSNDVDIKLEHDITLHDLVYDHPDCQFSPLDDGDVVLTVNSLGVISKMLTYAVALPDEDERVEELFGGSGGVGFADDNEPNEDEDSYKDDWEDDEDWEDDDEYDDDQEQPNLDDLFEEGDPARLAFAQQRRSRTGFRS